jgi:putative transposase
LNDQLDRQSAKCVGFVVMPDHVHAVVWFPKVRQLSRFMHGWKRLSSFGIRQWYRDDRTAYFEKEGVGFGERFWTPKYYAFEIHSQEKLTEKINYMHMNPVRAGLAERATDYKWSSARWYEWGKSVGVSIEWVF